MLCMKEANKLVMKKLVLFLITAMFWTMTSLCSAAGFSLDRSVWNNFANINNMEIFYNQANIKKDGNKAKVWLCYHYLDTDTYRVILREYTRGSSTASTLKTIDYYSDGSFKKGTTKCYTDLKMGINEEQILQRIW